MAFFCLRGSLKTISSWLAMAKKSRFTLRNCRLQQPYLISKDDMTSLLELIFINYPCPSRNNRTLRIIFTLLFGLFIMVGFSQNIKFTHLTVKQGLSQGNIRDIHQDRYGFMWFATEDGLNRYDGYSFVVHRNDPTDSFSISNNNIRCIAEEASGNLWLGTHQGLNLYSRETKHFKRFVKNPSQKGGLSNNDVLSILIDTNENIWVGTSYGLNFYNIKTKTFSYFFHDSTSSTSLSGNIVKAIFEDSRKRIWLGTSSGLSLLNPDGNSFTNFKHNAGVPSSLYGNDITTLFEDKDHVLWIGVSFGGLSKMTSWNVFKSYQFDQLNRNGVGGNTIRSMDEDKAGTLWIATDNGLTAMNKNNETFTAYHEVPGDKQSLSSSVVTKVFFDVNDRMWVGTMYGGINEYDKGDYSFLNFRNSFYDKNSLSNNDVKSFAEDRDGNFWIATDGGGLNYYNRKLNTFTIVSDKFASRKTLCVRKDKRGGLWVGMWMGGLDYFNPITKQIKHYRYDEKEMSSLSDDRVFYILEDHKGNMWFATWGNGLNKYNPNTDDFTRFVHNEHNPNSVSKSPMDFLAEDSNGKIWIGTEEEGLDMYDPQTNIFTHYKNENRPGSLTSNYVTAIFEDSKKRLWIGTNGGGLNLFNRATKTFVSFLQTDGLPSNNIVAIEEDARGNLWLATYKGLSRFNPEKNTFNNFTEGDGLQSEQFNRWASVRLSSNELLFGGTNGFNLFNPKNVKDNMYKPPVYITGFRILNREAGIEENELLQTNIFLRHEIKLNYLQNAFSLAFSALNYREPEENLYSYKLEGFDKEWSKPDTERKVVYSNLDPGEYIFRVKASNNDGLWNEKDTTMKITITPPYWSTWWFITIIGILVGVCISAMLMARERRIANHRNTLEQMLAERSAEAREQKETLESQAENMQTLHEEQQAQTEFLQVMNEELQAQQLEVMAQREEAERARKEAEEANQAKSIFLATMSHEIRTPMNGVLGMAELLSETLLTTEQKEYANTIINSGEALLTVINDILDFSKIESKNLELDNHSFVLRHCLEEVMDMFSAKAAEKELDLIYNIDYDIPHNIIGDSHRLRQILINLINNALKFTDKGEIFLEVTLVKCENNKLEIAFHVHDTGIGIAEDKIPRLFKAFSQVDSSTTRKYGGTGLGLVISQRLVEFMGGSLSVQSKSNVGTTFSFNITCEVGEKSIQASDDIITDIKGRKILVVDDNATNRKILKGQLEKWKLLPTLVSSGNEVLELLTHNSEFDILITDMHMPEMDGLQLSRIVKEKFSSLPILLLSSVGDESKKKHPEIFSYVLNKPVKQQQLYDIIHLILNPKGPIKIGSDKKLNNVLSENFALQYPLRIMLAEDNPVNQKLALRVLEKLGYDTVELAQTGVEVLEKFKVQFYDVILMDVQMPEMDGLEATRTIRSNGGKQPIIISMTANAMQEDRDICLAAGMNDYISKPIKLQHLVDGLRRASETLHWRSTNINPNGLID